MKRALFIPVMLSAVSALAACGGNTTTSSGAVTIAPGAVPRALTTAAAPLPPGSNGLLMEGSSVRSYDSLAELSKEATIVAAINPSGPQRGEAVSGLPFTVATVTVGQVFKGTIPSGATLDIRQLGDATSGGLMVPGQSYVAFLQPFEFTPGHPTRQYVVIGGLAGLYWQSAGMLQRVDAHSTHLPLLISTAQIEEAVRGS